MYGRIWWCPTSFLMTPKPVSFCYSYFWLRGAELWIDPVLLEPIIASFPAKLLSFWRWTLPRFTGWRAMSWWAPPSASLSQNLFPSTCSPPEEDWLFSMWRHGSPPLGSQNLTAETQKEAQTPCSKMRIWVQCEPAVTGWSIVALSFIMLGLHHQQQRSRVKPWEPAWLGPTTIVQEKKWGGLNEWFEQWFAKIANLSSQGQVIYDSDTCYSSWAMSWSKE